DRIAYAINSSGQVVGTASSGPFAWQNGVMTNLNTLVPANLAGIQSAYGINDNGQITGRGVFNGSDSGIGYLLTPSTSNPGTYTVTVLPNIPGTTTNNAWLFFPGFQDFGLSVNSSGQIAGVSFGFAAFWANPNTVSNLGNSQMGGGAFGINR